MVLASVSLAKSAEWGGFSAQTRWSAFDQVIDAYKGFRGTILRTVGREMATAEESEDPAGLTPTARSAVNDFLGHLSNLSAVDVGSCDGSGDSASERGDASACPAWTIQFTR